MDTSPPSPTTEVNSCLHSWHKLIKYNNPDKKEQIWESFVSGDLFWPLFPPCADGQKRKKSLRRKLDSLAKEKNKDKGTPTSFNTHSDILPFPSASLCLQVLSRLSPSPLPPSTQLVRHRGPVCGLHPSGRWTGRLQKQFLFTGLLQFIFSFSGATPCKGTGSEDQPLCCAKQTLHIWQEEQKT